MSGNWATQRTRTLTRLGLALALLLGGLIGQPRAVAADDAASARAATLLSQMSLEQKVGQLLLVYFQGPALSPTLRQLIVECHVGGIVLFSAEGNIQSMPQVAGLIVEAQRLAVSQPGGAPLLVAVDQEGGGVARLRNGFAAAPGQMAVAAGDSPAKAAELYRVTAQQLAALGVNMNLAPVLDVNNNPGNVVIGARSFGSDPAQVAQYGRIAIEAYQAGGIIATAKHFPGHGDTAVDSHVGLPVLAHSREQLDTIDLPPFREAIAAGVDAIMTAHLLAPAIENDPARPATLSPAVLQGLLRQELGFQGVIASDAMSMGAITQLMPVADAAVQAVQAGVDLLSFGGNGALTPAGQVQVYQRLVAAAQSGEIAPARLDDAVTRILTLKARRGLLDWAELGPLPADAVGNPGQSALAAMANDDAITLLRDDGDLVPLAPQERLLVLTRQNPILWSVAFSDCPNPVQVVAVPADPGAAYIAWATLLAAQADRVVLATSNARLYAGQAQLLATLPADKTIALSMSGPYDAPALAAAGSLLVAYEGTEGAVRAMARALSGQITPQGRLPVEVGGLYPRGYRWE